MPITTEITTSLPTSEISLTSRVMPSNTMATRKDITTDRQQLTGSALILTFVDDTERHKRPDVIPMIPAVSRNLARPSQH